MIHVHVDRLVTLVPHAAQVYLRAMVQLNAVLACFGLLTTPQRPAHFLAQILHESGGFRVLEENLTYTTPGRLMVVWPSRFPTRASERPYLRNPEALANKVYQGRLGNREPGDGWRYRGRGPIQLTGRDNYARLGRTLDIDLVGQPELAVSETYLLPIAAAWWSLRGLSSLADHDDVRGISKAIVGDTRSLPARTRWLEKTRGLIEVKT